MRQVGTLANQADAQRLSDYLLTRGIATRVDPSAAGTAVWVFDENGVSEAKQALADLQANPADPRFAQAAPAAKALREAEAERNRKAKTNVVDLRSRWQRPTRGRTPLTLSLILASVAVTVIGEFGDNREIFRALCLTPSGSLSLPEVRGGEIWRLWTPMLMHFDGLHLLFDMYWLYILGTLVELRRGPLLLAGLVIVGQLAGAVAQDALGQPFFGGMSGVVYALFGYIWIKSRFQPQLGLYLDSMTIFLMLLWLFLCLGKFTGKDVANGAHFAGIAVGMVWAFVPIVLRR